MRWLRFLVAAVVCGIALFLPYRARVAYLRAIALIVHLPFKVFGKLARFLLGQLGQENPYDRAR